MDGWMDGLRLYVLFNSISVISGRWANVNERLCAMEPRLRLRRFCNMRIELHVYQATYCPCRSGSEVIKKFFHAQLTELRMTI